MRPKFTVCVGNRATNGRTVTPVKIRSLSGIFRKVNWGVLVAGGLDLLLRTGDDVLSDLITATTSSKTSKNSGTTAVIEAMDVKANAGVDDKDCLNSFCSIFDCIWRHNGSRHPSPERKQYVIWNEFNSRISHILVQCMHFFTDDMLRKQNT